MILGKWIINTGLISVVAECLIHFKKSKLKRVFNRTQKHCIQSCYKVQICTVWLSVTQNERTSFHTDDFHII